MDRIALELATAASTGRKIRRTAGPPMSAQAMVKEHLTERTGARRSAYIEGLSWTGCNMKKTVTDGPDGKVATFHRADGRLARVVTYRPNGRVRYVQYREGGVKFMVGKLTVLEELEVYKAMNAGPVHMYAPSLNSRRTSGSAAAATSQEAASSASSPASAAPGSSRADPPLDKG